MKHAMLATAAMLAMLGAAKAQVVTSEGSGLGYDCFVHAKLAIELNEGLQVCGLALDQGMMVLRDTAATYDNRGVILVRLGRNDEAQSDFSRAIALRPELGDPYVNLGSILIRKHEYDQAISQINLGLDRGISYPQVGYYDRALAQELAGRYKEAYYDYKKALELEPDFTLASDRLKYFVVTTTPAPKAAP